MFSSMLRPSSSRYEALSLRAIGDGCGGSSSTSQKRLSSEDDSSASLLEGSDNLPAQASPQPSVRRLILYLSLAVVLLSAANVALLFATLSMHRDNCPLSDTELDALSFGDTRPGLDKVQVANPTSPQTYHRAWPDRIVRVSRKLKKAVWGQAAQVYVTVEVRTPQFFCSFLYRGIHLFALSVSPLALCAVARLLTLRQGLNNHAVPPPPRQRHRQRLCPVLAGASRAIWACQRPDHQGGRVRNRSMATYRPIGHHHLGHVSFYHGRARLRHIIVLDTPRARRAPRRAEPFRGVQQHDS